MLLLRQLSHQETRLLSLQHGRHAKTIDLTACNGYLRMRTITGNRLRLVLQPHTVSLSGFRNPQAPLTIFENPSSFIALKVFYLTVSFTKKPQGML